MNGKHLTFTERQQIEKMYNHGTTYRAIAKRLGRAVSGIYREVQRGLYEHLDGKTWLRSMRYSADKAQARAEYERTAHGRPVKLGARYDYAETVKERIKAGESPDSITGDMKKRGQWTVSTTTLYRYIDRGYIPGISNSDLWEKSKRKRAYHKVRIQKRPSPGLTIDKREQEITDCNTFGHWEMDCVIGQSKGKEQAILVFTERKTRYELIYKLREKTSHVVNNILKSTLQKNPRIFKTITCDNGSEFARAFEMPIPVYYCHAYSSWERGRNENCNRLIRRFLPKGESMKHVTQGDCIYIAHNINNLIRKRLNYRTAEECFREELEKMGVCSFSY